MNYKNAKVKETRGVITKWEYIRNNSRFLGGKNPGRLYIYIYIVTHARVHLLCPLLRAISLQVSDDKLQNRALSFNSVRCAAHLQFKYSLSNFATRRAPYVRRTRSIYIFQCSLFRVLYIL